MKEKDKFDALTREYVKATREFICGNATYFTRMPNGFRVSYIEDDNNIGISIYQDKKLEQQPKGLDNV